MKMAATTRFSSSITVTPTLLSSTPLQRDLPFSRTPVSAQVQFPIKRMLAGAGLQTLKFRRMEAAAGQNSEAVGSRNSVPVRVAYELLQAGHRYLDVRTEEEFSRGHVEGFTKNPNFLEEVVSHFKKHDEILVGCQSGKRSLMAAADLISAGFTSITDVAGGFSTWTQTGLPMEQ